MRAIITQREDTNAHGSKLDSLESEYVAYFEKLGIILYPVSNFTRDALSFAAGLSWDMLILTGGGELSNECYRRPRSASPQPERDRVEDELIALALRDGKRILGVCRGMQKLNCYFGGRISDFENLKEQRAVRLEHEVTLTDGYTFYVNNYHKDGIFMRDLGEGIIPAAMDKANGIVEAFTHAAHNILGVQWHPERNFNTAEGELQSNKLIAEFCR